LPPIGVVLYGGASGFLVTFRGLDLFCWFSKRQWSCIDDLVAGRAAGAHETKKSPETITNRLIFKIVDRFISIIFKILFEFICKNTNFFEIFAYICKKIMKKNINIVLFILICIPFKGFCEIDEDYRMVSVSLGAGGFWANKYVANYYNGSEKNVNKISYIWNNSYFNEQIRQALNLSYGAPLGFPDLPTNMRYKISTAVTARFAFNLSLETSFFIQVNQVNLTATDIFTVYLGNTPGTTNPILEIGRIWGKESRTMLDVGFQRRNELEARNWFWFYELAFNLTNTRVRENVFEIAGFKQSIIDRGTILPGQGFSSPEMPQTAIGIGLAGTLGWQYRIGSNASFDFGFTTYLQDINLEGYKKFHTNFNLFVRLNFLTL